MSITATTLRQVNAGVLSPEKTAEWYEDNIEKVADELERLTEQYEALVDFVHKSRETAVITHNLTWAEKLFIVWDQRRHPNWWAFTKILLFQQKTIGSAYHRVIMFVESGK